MQHQISKRVIRLFVFSIIAVFLIFIYRLYSLQINDHKKYEQLAEKQMYVLFPTYEDRGSIIFLYKDGREFFAATNNTGYTVELNPKIIKNPEDTYNILSTIIEIEPNSFFEKINKKNDNSEILFKRLDINKAEEIENLKLQGVVLSKDKWRFCPGKKLASQVIGFQSYKGDEKRGSYGLERYYDEILRKDSKNSYNNFFVQIFSELKTSFSDKNKGATLVSTIDPNVQTYVEEIVSEINDKYSSNKTGAIIMDPATGEIYAMALVPNFDVNNFNKEEDISVFNNNSVESVYEMGSIIKALSMAIGLDTKAVTKETTYNDIGKLTMDGFTIYNYDKKGRGVVNMQEVLNQSLNTGVSFVVYKVGSKTFADYMKKLLSNKSGIDLPNEVLPLASNLDSQRDVEMANISFGQGIAVTPVQTVRALATLSNGGYLVKPHIIKTIKFDDGTKKEVNTFEKEQVFSKETSEKITEMLVTVVDKALLGGTVSMKNYSIAAKTGTAQIADSSTGGYYSDRYLHSFFGYFPAYNPKFIILMYTIEPKGVSYASHTLTLPFIDIVKYLINYYQIEPDR